MILVLLPMCFSGFYFYNRLSSILIKNAFDNLDKQISKTNENLELSFKILDNTSFHFLSSKNIRDWLSSDLPLDGDILELL